MKAIEVPPLATADATALARDLLEGEGRMARDLGESARVIAEESDGFPYYIHHIVDGLRDEGLTADPSFIRDLVARRLVDSNDPWDLAHYRTRIPVYYKLGRDAKLVGLVLEALAAEEPLAVAQLQDEINAAAPGFDDRDNLVRVLRLMEQDHYLRRDREGRIGFRFPLIRRWWRLDRGL